MSWLYDLMTFRLLLSVSLFNSLHTYLALGNRDVLTPEMRTLKRERVHANEVSILHA